MLLLTDCKNVFNIKVYVNKNLNNYYLHFYKKRSFSLIDYDNSYCLGSSEECDHFV